MYKTGAIKVKTQIIETIFAELPQTAKKVKFSIKFDQEEKLNTFKRLEAEREQNEQECASMESDSQSEQENNLNQDSKDKDSNPSGKHVTAQKQVFERLRYQKIEVSLEEAIIYKQFYEKEFEKLGEINNVKIKIRAQKISFQGYDIEDIEDAMDEARALMDKIQVGYIPKYGLQISESTMIKKMLQKIGIKIFKILDKYYRWYEVNPKLSPEEQRKKKNDIKEVLRKIDSGNHCLQYLSTIEKNVDVYKGSLNNDFQKLRYKLMGYRPLLESLKGQIFEKEFKSKLNEQSMTEEQIEVELSLSKDALVFHSVANQLLEMSIKDVKTMYQSYDYFFLSIDSDNSIEQAIQTLKQYEYDTVMQKSRVKPAIGQIQQLKQINYIHFETNYQKVKTKIQNKLNDPAYCGDYVPKESVVFCVGFRRKLEEKKMEYLCEILQKLQHIWGGASYKISILLDQPEEIEDPRLSYQFNNNQRIFSLTANQTSIDTNLSILREYVIRKKIEIKRIKQPNLDPDENNVSLSIINPKSVINESTILHEKSISQDMNASAILEGISVNKSILGLGNGDIKEEPDEKCLKLLANYKVYIAETSKEYNEKYKDASVEQNTIVKVDKRNRTIEDDLTKITDCNFQVYKILLNPKHKIDSYYQDPVKDEIVTVFLSAKVSPFVKPKGIGLKIEEGMNETFPVSFLNKSKETLSENGYLLNISKTKIIIDGKRLKVKYGDQFEVGKELTFLKK